MFTNPQRVDSEESKRLRQEAGAWLRSIRISHGLVQREVAEAIGFRFYTHYAQIESGIGRVSADRLHLLAAALGLDPKDMTRRLMRAYDPETALALFGKSNRRDSTFIVGSPMQKPISVPEYSAEDVKRLRQEAGRVLREKREALGLSQTDLAEPLGYKFYTRISQIERGIGRVPPEDYVTYARCLEMDLRDFVKTLLAHYDPMVHHLAFLDEQQETKTPAA